MTDGDRPLVEVFPTPDLRAPVLVLAVEGWVDAAGAAAAAARHLGAGSAHRVARFDTDRLLDHRTRRPMLELVDGVTRGVRWPELVIDLYTELGHRDVLVLHGPEPDHEWETFADTVVSLADELCVELVVGLGAYPAAVPHTRPTRLSCTAASAELMERLDFVTASLEVPAGVQAIIEVAAAAVGLPAVGIWAQVPHYLSASGFPPATEAILDGLADLIEVPIDLGAVAEKSLATRTRLDELVARNPVQVTMLETLEEAYDDLHDVRGSLPSGDDLAAQLERFLREQ